MDLSANLEIFKPIEFINLITYYKHTGALYFDISGENGEVYFEDGIPVHAEYKGMNGIEAVYNLSILNNGTLQFKEGVKVKEHTINKEEINGLINNIEKRKIEFDDVLKKLPPFDAVLEKRADGVQDGVALRKTDWTIIRLVDGKRDINSIIKQSGMPILEVCKTLEWLMEKGLLFDKSLSERLVKDFEKILNNVLEVFSVKGTNSKEWAEYIIDSISHNGFETIGGFLKLENEEIKCSEDITKVLTEEALNKVKELVYNKALERANEELGKMIAKKKYKELLSKEGEK